MLSGINHNIRYQDRVFHVQTEDRGIRQPRVTTHVFLDGSVIAESLSNYEALLAEDQPTSERAVAIRRLMQTQHKTALKELVAGAYDNVIAKFIGVGAAVEQEHIATLEDRRPPSVPPDESEILDVEIDELEIENLDLDDLQIDEVEIDDLQIDEALGIAAIEPPSGAAPVPSHPPPSMAPEPPTETHAQLLDVPIATPQDGDDHAAPTVAMTALQPRQSDDDPDASDDAGPTVQFNATVSPVGIDDAIEDAGPTVALGTIRAPSTVDDLEPSADAIDDLAATDESAPTAAFTAVPAASAMDERPTPTFDAVAFAEAAEAEAATPSSGTPARHRSPTATFDAVAFAAAAEAEAANVVIADDASAGDSSPTGGFEAIDFEIPVEADASVPAPAETWTRDSKPTETFDAIAFAAAAEEAHSPVVVADLVDAAPGGDPAESVDARQVMPSGSVPPPQSAADPAPASVLDFPLPPPGVPVPPTRQDPDALVIPEVPSAAPTVEDRDAIVLPELPASPHTAPLTLQDRDAVEPELSESPTPAEEDAIAPPTIEMNTLAGLDDDIVIDVDTTAPVGEDTPSLAPLDDAFAEAPNDEELAAVLAIIDAADHSPSVPPEPLAARTTEAAPPPELPEKLAGFSAIGLDADEHADTIAPPPPAPRSPSQTWGRTQDDLPPAAATAPRPETDARSALGVAGPHAALQPRLTTEVPRHDRQEAPRDADIPESPPGAAEPENVTARHPALQWQNAPARSDQLPGRPEHLSTQPLPVMAPRPAPPPAPPRRPSTFTWPAPAKRAPTPIPPRPPMAGYAQDDVPTSPGLRRPPPSAWRPSAPPPPRKHSYVTTPPDLPRTAAPRRESVTEPGIPRPRWTQPPKAPPNIQQTQPLEALNTAEVVVPPAGMPSQPPDAPTIPVPAPSVVPPPIDESEEQVDELLRGFLVD